MGDMHNLFGRVNEMCILLDSYEQALEGYTYLNCFGPSPAEQRL